MKYVRWISISVTVGFAGFIVPPSSADNLTTMAILTGACKSAMAMDVSVDPRHCKDKVINMVFPNGRVGFSFVFEKTADDPVVVSFFGEGKKQLPQNADTVMQPIDRVNFTFQGSTDNLVAAGACRYSNPYRGVPSIVSCTAETNQGKFSADFVSNGKPPDTNQSR